MKNIAPLLITLMVLVSAKSGASSDHIYQQLQLCKKITNNTERLTCFDQINHRSNDSTDAAKATTSHDEHTKQPSSFPSLMADLGEANFFISYGNLDFLGGTKKAVLFNAGMRHPINTFDWSEGRPLSFNVFGQIRSQFDVNELDIRNNRGGALINTDFSVGGELVQSLDHWNWRFSYTHKSTHLGDEFIIDNQNYLQERINLSFEAVKWTAQTNINHWDLYAGVGFITRSEPGNLDQAMWQLGWQFQGDYWHGVKPIWAIDLKSWGAFDWNINVNMRAGIEISQWTQTPFQILFEYQDGRSPYGQFFTEDLTFTGLTFLQNW
ncbi:DUF1207 domain-containing protein [Marinicella litoralis]|uniref:Uncharacterized protein DUF1207 n=1 Tax=Marinicella litoralis TaxID=644220 RepID=A0A4R6XQ51_9GAMM|nr:DUF1207 domain-containing protein [Marinicella litoralis]TDR18358.1 uncharacterized protein DUF1207 [Marinicella litoralis]